jgi:hypothetical protein
MCHDDHVEPLSRRTWNPSGMRSCAFNKGATMQSESTLWDLLLQILGINPGPETLPADEGGILWVPGG